MTAIKLENTVAKLFDDTTDDMAETTTIEGDYYRAFWSYRIRVIRR